MQIVVFMQRIWINEHAKKNCDVQKKKKALDVVSAKSNIQGFTT